MSTAVLGVVQRVRGPGPGRVAASRSLRASAGKDVTTTAEPVR